LRLRAYIYRYYIAGGVLAAVLVPQIPAAMQFRKLYIEPVESERRILYEKDYLKVTRY
jgi:hypothetical protein